MQGIQPKNNNKGKAQMFVIFLLSSLCSGLPLLKREHPPKGIVITSSGRSKGIIRISSGKSKEIVMTYL